MLRPNFEMSKEYFQTTQGATSYKKFRPEMPSKCVDRIIHFLAETFDIKECVAADVGCGSGQSSLPMAVHLKKVIGIDSSEAQLKEASEINDPRNGNVEYKLGSAENLPLSDASVHLVYCVFAAHWFDLKLFLKEADRVLIPGGTLALFGTDYTMEFNKKWHQQAMESYEQLIEKTKPYWDEKYKNYKNFYVDFQSPYKPFIRDHTVMVYETLTVKALVERLKTVSSVGKYLADKPDQAMEDITLFQDELMRLLESTSSPDKTSLTYGFQQVMIFCRKPV